MSSFFLYLFQVSVCHMAFYILYQYFFKRYTFFQANRFYLLSATALSIILPLLSIGIWNSESMENFNFSPFFLFSEIQMNLEQKSSIPSHALLQGFSFLEISLFILYISGVLLYGFKLIKGLLKVNALINENTVINKGWHKIITIKSGPSFFSFLRYIFINDQKLNLSHEDLNTILSHEQAHIQQNHTFDILFMEMVTALFWFNPFMHRIKNSICQIHEYIADSQVVSKTVGVDAYSKLILKLSSGNNPIPLTHQFSMIHIKNRITMLNQTKISTMKTFKLLLALPLVLLLMSFFSFTDKPAKSTIKANQITNEKLIIGTISWEGNTKYSDDVLSSYLKIKKGDTYNREKIDHEISYNPEKVALSDLYMNEGHLFFSIKIEEEIVDNTVNLIFKVYEGNTIKIDEIIIKGNTKVETVEVLKMINFKSGDLFNRLKVIESQKNIAESGFFKSDEVGINPIPHDDFVDIEFVLIEL